MVNAIQSVQPVTLATASAGSAVKAFLFYAPEGSSYVTTTKGDYDLIAGTPAVKKALAALAAQGYGSKIISMHGRVYKREGASPGYLVTSFTVVADTTSIADPFTIGGKYFATLNGRRVELKAMTKDAANLLRSAVAVHPSNVTGVLNGDKFEVWTVAIARRRRQPQPARIG